MTKSRVFPVRTAIEILSKESLYWLDTSLPTDPQTMPWSEKPCMLCGPKALYENNTHAAAVFACEKCTVAICMHFLVMICSQECSPSLRSPGCMNKLTGIQREMSLDTANKMVGIEWKKPLDSFLGSVGQLAPTMLMESVWHTATLTNTSGHYLMVLMNFPQLIPMQHAPVSLGTLMETLFLHLWGRTISVRQA